MPIEIVMAHLSSSSVLIPLALYFLNRAKISPDLKPLAIILSISLLCDVLSLILRNYSVNTYPLGNFYLFAQFSILYFLFFRQLNKPHILKWIFILFIAVSAFIISFENPFILQTVSTTVGSIILMSLSLYYLYTLLVQLPAIYIHRLPFMWISFAVLAYYAGNLFLFLLSNYLGSDSVRMIWMLHNFLNVSKNILFAIAIWQASLNTKSSI
jgi:hypothetical protein